jgi:hypothetical protein
MKMTEPSDTEPSTPKAPSGDATQSKELPVELDRRGKPLPVRQRVGGIITPQ